MLNNEMKSKKCLAFLDILGFSDHIMSKASRAQEGSVEMLASIAHVFQLRLIEHKHRPWSKYSMSLQALAKRGDISSFESFLPMSDSIFIIGHDANTFLDQLSSFMCECFRYTSNEYIYPMDKNSPERVSVQYLKEFNNKGEMGFDEIETQWYPNIFRAGVSFDEVTFLQVETLIRNENFMSESESKNAKDCNLITGLQPILNIAGKGVVQAVSLEKDGGKGPKLYLDESIIHELNDEHMALVVRDDKGMHFLWPAYSLIWENDLELELNNECSEFLLPAINLWTGYKGKPYECHYYEFVKLIVDSYIAIARRNGCEDPVKSFLENYFNKKGCNIQALL